MGREYTLFASAHLRYSASKDKFIVWLIKLARAPRVFRSVTVYNYRTISFKYTPCNPSVTTISNNSNEYRFYDINAM